MGEIKSNNKMMDETTAMAFLKKQANDFAADYGMKQAIWMLDCKVLSACGVWYMAWLNDPKDMIESVKKFTSPIMIISEAYHILVNRNAIKPVKDFDSNYQKELIGLTKELFGDSDQNTLFKWVKMVHLFSQLPCEIVII